MTDQQRIARQTRDTGNRGVGGGGIVDTDGPVGDTNTREPGRWSQQAALGLFEMPFMDLLFEAQQVHRRHHTAGEVQLSQLKSIKTGGCAEDCAYCPQSAKFAAETGLAASKLDPLEDVLEDAKRARAAGASRYCMGAAWTRPKDRDLDKIIPMIKGVKALGMEACVTLGMLTGRQSERLKEAGLDYYNHNIDTSERYYREIITTRTFGERLDTLEHVRQAGIHVCSGGIVGMGEAREDRAAMLVTLANLPQPPKSVPINHLVRSKGTPLENAPDLDPFEFVRTIAAARIMMPQAVVRLSAGREDMSDETQALCFLAGAGSIFYGEQLLTTPNPEASRDRALFDRLGLVAQAQPHS